MIRMGWRVENVKEADKGDTKVGKKNADHIQAYMIILLKDK